MNNITKKNNLGKYVFIALIIGIVSAQLIRYFIKEDIILQEIASNLNLITTIFLHLIKMIIAPLVFSTLIVGISKLSDTASLGRIFLKTMLLFLVGSVLSLGIGLIVINYFAPGTMLGKTLLSYHSDLSGASQFANAGDNLNLKNFLTHMIPSSVVKSFAENNIIQIVIFSIFFGVAGVSIGKKAAPVFDFLELISKLMFKVTDYVMLFAPLAVFSAVSTIIVKNGFGILSSYLTYVMVFAVAVIILWVALILLSFLVIGKKVFQLIYVLGDSLGIAFSTSSSESVLPMVLEELDKLGIKAKISGFVLPMGYSFNLVASTLNCIFATMFIVQAYGQKLTLSQQITMCLILIVTSKGIAGVPRASLIIVATTLASIGLPEAAVLILFPIDGFLDMARSATNVFANALSATIIDKWEKK